MNVLSELSTGRLVALPKPVLIGLAALAGTTAIGGTWFASRGSPIAVEIGRAHV